MRLDKWLWVARFFKTRALASEAAEGGKVKVNGARAKPGKEIQPGQRLEIQRGEELFSVVVRGVAPMRGPASAAVQLYEESAESRQQREEAARQRQEQAKIDPLARPTKLDRRKMVRLRGW
ncbi:MAG: hypothetical protein HQL51_15345 [Magnetococcales bacterium]|nr:hypothetical protein [Magnetococcales bacterium]